MDRLIGELLELKEYEGLSHNEVMALIEHFSFLAKCNAQCEMIKSSGYMETELERMRILLMYDNAKMKLNESNTELKQLREKLEKMQAEEGEKNV